MYFCSKLNHQKENESIWDTGVNLRAKKDNNNRKGIHANKQKIVTITLESEFTHNYDEKTNVGTIALERHVRQFESGALA